ncbi:hypothetical protein K432DRAFT_215783 [Lepidopterella palustris CBS 459.81]|uniref:Uncharacterized protein n=1 Tax=Lepidopterella palustris CBS 459.81 TaxID=1314670 RepID=A0A8E2EEY9_9PEZI|nr:hypothetical protein K432DRAFT_215783 [Lepidopterella palustris CBS 459.81]
MERRLAERSARANRAVTLLEVADEEALRPRMKPTSNPLRVLSSSELDILQSTTSHLNMNLLLPTKIHPNLNPTEPTASPPILPPCLPPLKPGLPSIPTNTFSLDAFLLLKTPHRCHVPQPHRRHHLPLLLTLLYTLKNNPLRTLLLHPHPHGPLIRRRPPRRLAKHFPTLIERW